MNNLQEDFDNWLNELLNNNPLSKDTMAVNFNIYDMKNTYDVQFISSSMYDENNDDWACEENFSSNENCFLINKCKEYGDRELALENIEELIFNYIEKYPYLKQFVAITTGFVDDKIEVVWNSDDE